MSVSSWVRRTFKNAVSTTDTLASGMGAGDTSFLFTDGSTFPTSNFIVTVDQGQSAEEKILVATRSGQTGTVATGGRGYNGTTAASHLNGASILHTIDAQDMDEANQVAVATLGAIAAKGDILTGSGANMLVKTSVGADGTVLTAQATQPGGVAFVTPFAAIEAEFTAAQQVLAGTGVGTGGVIDLVALLASYFTADNQMVVGTGLHTATVIDFLAQLEQYFSAKGQLIVGTGTATGDVHATPASDGLVLTSLASTADGLTWQAPALPATQYAQITSNQSGITSLVAITGLSVTITVAAGQNLKITAFTYLFTTAGGIPPTDQYTVGIYEGATLLNEAVVSTGNGAVAIARISPSAGSHTYIVQAARVTGSDAGIFGAGATTPAFILAEITG